MFSTVVQQAQQRTRRTERRIQTRLLAELRLAGRRPGTPCIVQNISSGGARVVTEAALSGSHTLSLSIPQFSFTMPVRLVWRRHGCCGLEFDYHRSPDHA